MLGVINCICKQFHDSTETETDTQDIEYFSRNRNSPTRNLEELQRINIRKKWIQSQVCQIYKMSMRFGSAIALASSCAVENPFCGASQPCSC
ncbi:predicted protein [Botrytis cinerea T4]|uniref:Uncharacterized protein n=1 Tax=Botryotinia fuckeliana (strain T4) TaxID=999810 RepID=G2YQE6_BOTF4|nr:predicted protein [Botrytis cinerea T4]